MFDRSTRVDVTIYFTIAPSNLKAEHRREIKPRFLLQADRLVKRLVASQKPKSKIPKGEPLRLTQGCSISPPVWTSLLDIVSPLPFPI